MGLQTLDRALDVLKLVGQHLEEGVRFTDIQNKLHLSKSTSHRLISAMMAHDLLQRDESTRLYRLGRGMDIYRWLGMEPKKDLRSNCMPSVLNLAKNSGDSVFLVVRDRTETVCISRESGAFPIRAFTVNVGTRRPLGIGAGGISMLAALPEKEALDIVASVSNKLSTFPLTSDTAILSSVETARERGYAFSDGQVAKGVCGVAVSIRDSSSVVVAAIGIAAISDRMKPSRIPELIALLKSARRTIEHGLCHSSTFVHPISRVVS